MKVIYSINLKGYYSDVFNTFYVRTIGLDGDKPIIIKDCFEGHLNYNLFDEEDKTRAHNEARAELQPYLDNIIENFELNEEVMNIVDILNKNKNIKEIKLKNKIYDVLGCNFILVVTVDN